jgi:hypothetical protein
MVSVLAGCPSSAARPRIPTGWWQSTGGHSLTGFPTSFELVRTGPRRYEVRHLLSPANDCGSGEFPDGDAPTIAVDRRGRFRYRIRGQSDGITAVSGRLRGWRRGRATLRVYWDVLEVSPDVWCRMTYTFPMRPVKRVPVRVGRCSGADSTGRPVEFRVLDDGRFLGYLSAPGPYAIRCADGSVGSARADLLYGWIRADGAVDVGEPWEWPAEGITFGARLTGTSATGSFRLVAVPPEPQLTSGPSCDSDPVPFQAAWVGPR